MDAAAGRMCRPLIERSTNNRALKKPLIGLSLTLLVFAATAAGQTQPPVELETLLTRAGVYITRFATAFANVVAEERYVQQASGRQTMSGAGRGAVVPGITGQQRRELVSDFLLVKLAGDDMWVPFRDVFEVDGRPVREREERLTRLLLSPTGQTLDQARLILEESARYNIGNVERTINMPLLALGFLEVVQQGRFRFTLGKEEGREGSGLWVVNYTEQARPTFVRTPDGRNLFASGRFWIEAASGRVVKTELVFQDDSLRASVTTSFRTDDRFHVDVPFEMAEDYLMQRSRDHITGHATYGRFRRFDVTANEDIPLPVPPPLP